MDGNISHLYSVMETGRQDGQILMQHALIDLHKTGQISNKTLMQNQKNPTLLQEYLEYLQANQ